MSNFMNQMEISLNMQLGLDNQQQQQQQLKIPGNEEIAHIKDETRKVLKAGNERGKGVMVKKHGNTLKALTVKKRERGSVAFGSSTGRFINSTELAVIRNDRALRGSQQCVSSLNFNRTELKKVVSGSNKFPSSVNSHVGNASSSSSVTSSDLAARRSFPTRKPKFTNIADAVDVQKKSNMKKQQSPVIKATKGKQELMKSNEVHLDNLKMQLKVEGNESDATPKDFDGIQSNEVTGGKSNTVNIPMESAIINDNKDSFLSLNSESSSVSIRCKIATEEEAKAALAMRRHLQRQHLEAKKLALLKEQEAEAERQRQYEEEFLLLAEQQRVAEEERLRKAIEEAKLREEREKLKRKSELRRRAEREAAESKAREKAKQRRIEAEKRFEKEQREREERRKRVRAIISRIRRDSGSTTSSSNSIKETEKKDDGFVAAKSQQFALIEFSAVSNEEQSSSSDIEVQGSIKETYHSMKSQSSFLSLQHLLEQTN